MFYTRRLPHWQPDGVAIFLTWRLHGSLPRTDDRLLPPNATPGRKFLEQDREMDRAKTGPQWLKDPRVAACVVETLLRGESEWRLYELFAWVVMSNHVHVLLKPHKPISEIMRAAKRMSAQEANRILDRAGNPFWQDESYDHWVRTEEEFWRISKYIEENPV